MLLWRGSWLEGRLLDIWYPQPGQAAPRLIGAILATVAMLHGWFSPWLDARRRNGRRRLPVPVLLVGNLTVGGTGKTTLVMWLVEEARVRGLRPGVISRGYGRRAAPVHMVEAGDDVEVCGDEPLLLRRRCSVPVAVGRDRYRAAQRLIDGAGCDLIISDDGLQGANIERDMEVLAVDGERVFGNGKLLPAGPMRALPGPVPAAVVAVNGARRERGEARAGELAATLGRLAPRCSGYFHPRVVGLVDLAGRPLQPGILQQSEVVAACGIGNPARFAATLAELGLGQVPLRVYGDHHRWDGSEPELQGAGRLLVTTEKDAMHLRRFADRLGSQVVIVRIEADLDAALSACLGDWLQQWVPRREQSDG